MEKLHWLILLNILAALLPIIGFGRLLFRAQRALSATLKSVRERGHAGVTYDDFENQPAIDVAPRRERNDLLLDILFVGVGLVLGAVANIWSLYQ